ncbi:GNAT family N-acetyltransferase [Paludibacterium yongneupense]|uniref:GNAT family N-acetyltransferase n=1 Tax=Paludibacterium yongneupense TaxID=400061 RepID=UPI0004108E31|nr:GNAT family N-acetyltransferase [Paludibacterium yongneupense]
MKLTRGQTPLSTGRLRLMPSDSGWAAAMLDYQRRNRAHFTEWDPAPGDLFFTEHYWNARLHQRSREWDDGRGMSFLLTMADEPDTVIGVASLSNIVRGVFQSAYLGYSIDERHEGRGLMREALEAVLDFAFREQNLHRVQANYQPHNVRSAGLLKRLGFHVEGYAVDYLYLNGAWRDHVLTARLNPEFAGARLMT